jgi:hypothetical protein
VLRCSPGELYLDLMLTFPPDGPQPAIRPKGPDDPSLTALLNRLKEEYAHGAR